MNDTISVIIPIFNKSRFLRKALRSIREQTYSDLEIICIDDASTDNCFDALSELALQDPRIKVFRNESNLGIYANRLVGIRHATGSYTAFADADDLMSPQALELMLKAMVKYDVDLVQMRSSRIMGKLKVKYNETFDPSLTDRRIEGEEYKDLTSYVGMTSYITPPCWNKLYKTQILKVLRHVPFNQFWGDDQIFNIPYLKAAQSMAFIDYIGYHYRWGGATSRHYKYSALRDYKEVHRIKLAMGLDPQYLNPEIITLLEYHIRQLHTERGWTWEAIRMVLEDELKDPFWQRTGLQKSADELIADAMNHVQKNTFKYLVKRLLK